MKHSLTLTLTLTLTLLTTLLLAPLSSLNAAAPLAALHAADVAVPADWMPRGEDGTQMWWVEGPRRVFNNPSQSKEETLCFRYGGERLLFDTTRVRPVENPSTSILWRPNPLHHEDLEPQ